MNLRRRLSSLFLVGSLALALGACGGSAASGTGVPAAADAEAVTTTSTTVVTTTVATTPPTTPAFASSACGADEYRSSAGSCVPRPQAAPSAPAGASAQCRDGTYSFSQSRSGTCSSHGGVARWL